VELSYYGEDIFDEHLVRLLKEKPENESRTREYIQSLKKKYQGKVVAIVEEDAVQDKCIDLAKEKVGDFLQILRYYSPAALIPDVPSHFNTMGNEFIKESHVLMFEEDIPIITRSIEMEGYPFWDIDSQHIERLKTAQFWNALNIPTKKNKTELEDLWFRAIKIFNKAVVEREYHVKYVFLFAALESLFLANENEPISRSLSQRVAMLIKNGVEERENLVRNFKEANSKRSNYLHHGRLQENDTVIQEFQLNAWNAIYHILLSLKKFKTKSELTSSLVRSLLG